MAFKRVVVSQGFDDSADTATLYAGDLIINSNNELRLHDGVTPGGNNLLGVSNSLVNGSNVVLLDSTGSLNLPSISTIVGSNSDSNVYIETISGATTNTWTFDSVGHITFPDLTTQTTAYSGLISNLTTGSYTVSLTAGGDVILPSAGHIQGQGISQIGYQFAIATLANGDTTVNTNALTLTETSDTDLISGGWTIRDANNNTTTVSASYNTGGQTIVETGSQAFNCQFPLTFTSPDYTPEIPANVTLESNSNTWVFGTSGGLTFPDSTVQHTAWPGTPPNILSNETYSTTGSTYALDPNKQVHFLAGSSGNPGVYTLTTGSIGQMAYFMPVANHTDDGTTSVAITLNATLNNGGNYQYMGSITWYPFSPNPLVYNQIHRPCIPLPYAIYDGQGWIISGGTIA